MKIMSLNVWGGRKSDVLIPFIQSQKDVDTFCLQEVYHEAGEKDVIWGKYGPNFEMFRDITDALPEHEALYHPHLGDWWGLAMFVRKGTEILQVGETYVHQHNGYDPQRERHGHTAKNLQYVQTTHNGKPLTIINFHGLWNGQGKGDCKERLLQSQKIVEFLKTLEGEIVLCGDFNLLPDTESLKMIENTGLRNLISEYDITSTRTSFYEKPEKFADYMFVSKGLEVQNFAVLPDEVSDHAPLTVEVE